MTYFVIVTDTAGQGGINPRRVKIVTSDNLATVTSAGYLNKMAPVGFTMLATDIVDMIYLYSTLTQSGTYNAFTVGINGGIATLTEAVSGGDVLLPVVNGNASIFNGTTGQIKDAGNPPVLKSGSVVSGNVPVFSGTAGSVVDGGAPPLLTVTTNGQLTFCNTTQISPSIIGLRSSIIDTNGSAITSGLLEGFRGSVTFNDITSGIIYGIAGLVDPQGSIGVGANIAAVFGQFDLSAATIPSSTNMAIIWGDMGSNSLTGLVPGMFGLSITNNSALVTTGHINLTGGSSNLLYLDDHGSSITYFASAGTTSGSAGDTTKCNASKVLKVNFNGTSYWLPLFASNS